MKFPIICVDDFYKDPDKIRKFALTLEYKKRISISPGVRTDQLFNIDKIFFDKFCEKLFSLFYNFSVDSCKWNVETVFQKTFAGSEDPASILNKGWNHLDGNVLAAGVIYLNDFPDSNNGTTISELNSEKSNFDFTKRNLFYSNKHVDKSDYETSYIEHEKNFNDSLIIKNKYNRLIMYDSSYWHKESNFYCDESNPRLTQVFFIHNLESSTYPIQRIKSFDI